MQKKRGTAAGALTKRQEMDTPKDKTQPEKVQKGVKCKIERKKTTSSIGSDNDTIVRGSHKLRSDSACLNKSKRRDPMRNTPAVKRKEGDDAAYFAGVS